MSFPPTKRFTSRRGAAILSLGLLFLSILGQAQPQASGRIINRDGAPQPGCQIEFRVGNARRYGAASNNDGRFYVKPAPGKYTVRVTRGQQVLIQLDVTVDSQGGLHPSTIVI
jgi:hypothetical protein